MSLHVTIILPALMMTVALGPRSAAAQIPDREAPCQDAVYRQFDFWVGEWDVLTPEGQRAGGNRIEKLLNGCLLMEHWTSARGGQGKSINYYDPAGEKWIQTWVDGQGGIIRVEGAFEAGSMRFEGEHLYPDGRREHFRMTFTPQPDGSVHQFIEQSKDGGESWYVWFDGKYVRRTDEGEPQ
jgi:hypothetical protein